MPVKFKIGFQIDAETLFSIIAKFIPLDNLTVEEVFERPHAEHAQPRLAAAPRLIKAAKQKRKRASKSVDLNTGINRIILEALADGQPHPPIDLKNAIKAGGYSPHSLGSRMQTLLREGYVIKPDHGVYQIGRSP
jgi:hypothetical protein